MSTSAAVAAPQHVTVKEMQAARAIARRDMDDLHARMRRIAGRHEQQRAGFGQRVRMAQRRLAAGDEDSADRLDQRRPGQARGDLGLVKLQHRMAPFECVIDPGRFLAQHRPVNERSPLGITTRLGVIA